MTVEAYIAFLATVAVLVMVPGPVIGLVVALGGTRGRGAALAATAGASVSIALQLSAAAFGLASIMSLLGDLFEVLRWLAAAYLLYLAVTLWRAPVTGPEDSVLPTGRKAFFQGFFVSSTNPKSLVFFAAFFPQFIDASGSVSGQLLILTVTFQVVFTTGVAIYGLAAARLGGWVASKSVTRVRNKLLATLLGGSAVALAMMKR
ncbi:MAG: LysE family translocator [Pseudomonadota bacterium]